MSELHLWQKSLCYVLVASTLLCSCAGQQANPVDRYMLGDEKKSCKGLYAEVSQIDNEIVLKRRQKQDRDTWNVIFFVTGWFVIVPFFFIDTKGSYEIEIEALAARKKGLMNIYADKECPPITEPAGSM